MSLWRQKARQNNIWCIWLHQHTSEHISTLMFYFIKKTDILKISFSFSSKRFRSWWWWATGASGAEAWPGLASKIRYRPCPSGGQPCRSPGWWVGVVARPDEFRSRARVRLARLARRRLGRRRNRRERVRIPAAVARSRSGAPRSRQAGKRKVENTGKNNRLEIHARACSCHSFPN